MDETITARARAALANLKTAEDLYRVISAWDAEQMEAVKDIVNELPPEQVAPLGMAMQGARNVGILIGMAEEQGLDVDGALRLMRLSVVQEMRNVADKLAREIEAGNA